MKVWLVLLDDRVASLRADEQVLGVFASEDHALEWAQGDENTETIAAAGGWANYPRFTQDAVPYWWPTTADEPKAVHRAALGDLGSELVVVGLEVQFK